MNERKDVEALIKEHGGVLVRQKKHQVWKFPDGRIFTMASTPGDCVHAERNNMTDLRNFLGIAREIKKNPNRRTKRGAVKQTFAPEKAAPLPDWKRKLAGLLEIAAFKPKSCCVPVHLERVPMTPLWAILSHLLPFRKEAR